MKRIGSIVVSLDRVRENKCCQIRRIDSCSSSLGRLLPFGISIGNEVEMVHNRRFVPILIRVGDSLVALNRKQAQEILVEER